ncbi:hypothetical protein [Glutamicibacter sp. MCAF14]|uniref:hypothetical protein n=1 Tax=Glutamicibacter sp. MCAF14 TaxID=3233043 RepID=UPI003F904BCB
MSDHPTYEELVLRCQRLANIIVRNNNATEMLLRAEVKKAKASAWDEGEQSWYATTKPANPYKEQS